MWPQWQGQQHGAAPGEQHVQQPGQPEAFSVRPRFVPSLRGRGGRGVLLVSGRPAAHPSVRGFREGLRLGGRSCSARSALCPLPSHDRREIPPVLLPGSPLRLWFKESKQQKPRDVKNKKHKAALKAWS